MQTTLSSQTELPPQKAQRRERTGDEIPAYSPIIRHRIQRADWMTAQFGNLCSACGRFWRSRQANKVRLC